MGNSKNNKRITAVYVPSANMPEKYVISEKIKQVGPCPQASKANTIQQIKKINSHAPGQLRYNAKLRVAPVNTCLASYSCLA
ncbi:hypothetical protein H0A66_04435 [Alcaligenaceae bacterium]|nr:hypothetical protein [Alcaligenaceae bacterium]